VTGEELILALNNGRPLAPKIMFEFSRAAMHVEFRRGRKAVEQFLDRLYGDPGWSRAPVHDWLAHIHPPYVVDINRDTQLQDSYADTPHTLVVGVARLGGGDYRFRLYAWRDGAYSVVDDPSTVDPTLPVLFKPMGTPRPEGNYIASDADYVDYITELMGGFGLPPFIKAYRAGRRYLLLGMRLTRDTERMVLSDIVRDSATPCGWAFIPEPTTNERRTCERMGLTLVEAGFEALIEHVTVPRKLKQKAVFVEELTRKPLIKRHAVPARLMRFASSPHPT
jgi:hypothetical protein